MSTPPEILAVPRPKNTIISVSKSGGSLRYAVRERKGSSYANGKTFPINGKTIGHIINGVYVPLIPRLKAEPQYLSYGAAALVREVSGDLYDDLLKCFHPAEAQSIYLAALLKVLKPHIRERRYVTEYRCCFLSHWYPNVALSRNTLQDLFMRLGMNTDVRLEFFKLRISRVCKEDHIAIDGTLKQDSSTINTLSAYSHKGRVKGVEDISILYAYDIETMEPLCSEVFQGNSIDALSFSAFIRDNDLRKGVIVADKGFPPSALKDELVKRPDLHFIIPIKRNDRRIASLHLTDWDSMLYDIEGEVVCKKTEHEGRFYYAFKDNRRAGAESHSFLTHSRITHDFDAKVYTKKSEGFGLIVFESDLSLTCAQAWKFYDERWLLECLFREYKSCTKLNTTNSQTDFTVRGEEFVNFIAAVTASRVIKRFEKASLLNEDTYADVMEDLARLRRSVQAPDALPEREDRYWDQNPIITTLDDIEKLGLCAPSANSAATKRKRGRPRKNKEEKATPTENRKPGRPRIHQPKDPNAPKRGRGRPRTKPVIMDHLKRPRGRPKTHTDGPKAKPSKV